MIKKRRQKVIRKQKDVVVIVKMKSLENIEVQEIRTLNAVAKEVESIIVETTESEAMKTATLDSDTMKEDTMKAETMKAETMQAQKMKVEIIKVEITKAETTKAETMKEETVKEKDIVISTTTSKMDATEEMIVASCMNQPLLVLLQIDADF